MKMNTKQSSATLGFGQGSWCSRTCDVVAFFSKALLCRSLPAKAGVLMRIVFAAVLMLAGGAAQAYQCGSGYAVSPTISVPLGSTVITTSQPTTVGSWVGDWTPYSKTYANWWCYASNGDVLRPVLKGTGGYASPASITAPDGVNYAVFATGVSGLGVVFKWHAIYSLADTNGNMTSIVQEQSIDVPLLSGSYTNQVAPWNYNSGYQPTDIGIAISARYIMIGAIPAGTKVPAKASTQIGQSDIIYNGTNFNSNKGIYFSQTASTFPILGCTPVTAVSVPMGTYGTGKLATSGSRIGATNFNIALTGCPASMSGISISLHPVNGTIGASANSIATLAPVAGVATGVGLQITKSGTTTPVGFEVAFPSNSGYTGTAGNYNIPLTATYVNTGGTGTVTAGSANTQVEYTITYQ
ncbi:fimbrial protein [Silvimonas soli]|uniref:fimbrial protein n=1 Tax=Silvimonas soli TaxID=2980100 RepID=UPI0024B38596|nr:fimbrial protein [Silvimonas soli]